MKRNTQARCAALVAAVGLAHTATAAPKRAGFSRPGYTVYFNAQTGEVTANIGRRAAGEAGNRAAMRMFARLLRWYPRRSWFGVGWNEVDSRGRVMLTGADFQTRGEERGLSVLRFSPTTGEKSNFYQGVTRRIMRAVARRNGILRDVTRYGAVDALNAIEIDLGMRASYDAGSRAAMRTLARLLPSPFSAEYYIRWTYPMLDQDILVNYNPLFDHGAFIVNNGSDTVVAYRFVKKRAVIAVGRRSGTFTDLRKLGARNF